MNRNVFFLVLSGVLAFFHALQMYGYVTSHMYGQMESTWNTDALHMYYLKPGRPRIPSNPADFQLLMNYALITSQLHGDYWGISLGPDHTNTMQTPYKNHTETLQMINSTHYSRRKYKVFRFACSRWKTLFRSDHIDRNV